MKARSAVLRLFIASFLVLAITVPARADLVGLWTFDDVTGTDVPDSSGLGNNGVLTDGASTSAEFAPFLGSGQSLFINGGTQHVLVPDSDSLDIDGTEALTIAAWVKPIGNIGWDGIVAKSPGDGSAANHAGNYELRIENGSRKVTFHHQRGGVDDTLAFAATGPVIADNAWQHIAITATPGGQLNYYLDGLKTGSDNLPATFGATNGNPLYIGNRADLFTVMDGLIDDLRIYDEALSDQDIADLVGATIIPPEPPPAGLIPATIASATSGLGGGFNRMAEFLVDGSGLDQAAGTHTITPDGFMWLNNGTFTDPNDVDPELVFDLGEVTSVDNMRIWNYNEAANAVCCLNRGTAQMDVLVSDDGVNFQLLLDDVQLAIGPGDAAVDFSETFDLGGVEARFIKFASMTSHGGDNGFVGLSEVQFSGAPVPEPSSLALLAIAIVGLLTAARHRRR